MGIDTDYHQKTDASNKAAGDAVDSPERSTQAQKLLPDLKEQVPSTYISRGSEEPKEIDFGVSNPSKQANAGENRKEPSEKESSDKGRTQAQIADACWSAPDTKSVDFKIDENTRHTVIDKLVSELRGRYVNPELADKAAALLQSKERNEYSSIDSAEQFTKALNDDLRSVFQDKHLGVFFDDKALPADFTKTPADAMDKQLAQQICERSGVESVQNLEGNIGYLRLTGFFPSNSDADPRAVELTKQAIDSTMSKLADKDALIIDLRENTGGDPQTVLRTLNYLLDAGTHVNSIHWREGSATREERMVTREPEGQKFGSQKPIYLLTSEQTFSAGEEFAYDLQALGRAKVIGGITGGGANPTYAFRLTDHFGVAIPTAQSINPTTGKNWERSGVKPDVVVPPDQALDVAKTMLLSQLRKH